MILGFKFFHPLQGIPPDTFPEYGGDIIFRARALLSKRSAEEIFAAIEIIDWMIDQSPAKEEAEAELERQVKLEMVEGADNDDEASEESEFSEITEPDALIGRDIDSTTYALKARQAKFDITEDENFPNASWPELFAVLALSIIDQACEDELLFGDEALPESAKRDDWFYEYRTVSRASYWLIEAMDAVATAEGIHYFESRMAEVKQKIKIRNQQAAIQRHSKTNDALRVLKNFYLSRKHKSIRNAVQLFCEAYPAKVEHLVPYNRLRTLSEGLAKLLKGQRPSLQL